ncbi:hypothetical protein SPRG_14074 [Saprolegnia parasitica CBS 223.65]|uniref:B30.2/SPRY domain-containing protein n=1 Tax=Saprolegnia parasitica (strain CBS 223.65) TaxID=695850 RepID=A0A067BRG2_SAPPC|nr:hypothetical protein SPRG_14074 [Saprolegnia parasitica CBS 223.65]KDO20843.1 hypothetical protein SPRG_14074 [Saprolegnia parasitica CBS 223.65]|eukprot:XP_012208421.1 hypothetical protein SPRG_14074 [Saprolegnia parasitica CBS 223.65]
MVRVVATPYGLGALEADAASTDAVRTTVMLPWGRSYMRTSDVAPRHLFRATCLTSKVRHFDVEVALDCSLNDLRACIIEALGEPLFPETISVLQPTVGGRHRLTDGSPCIFRSLQPLLVVIAPLLQLGKMALALHLDMRPYDTSTLEPRKSIPAFETLHDVSPRLTLPSIVQVARGACAVVAKDALRSGVVYWEVRLDETVGGDGLFIGIGTTDMPLNTSVTSTGLFYGLAVASGQKVHMTPEAYGPKCANGDVLGVEFDVDRGTLGFYRNRVFLGIAFRNVFGKTLCAAFGTSGVGLRFTILPRRTPPSLL